MVSNEWARSQKWSAAAYDRHARFVSDLADEGLVVVGANTLGADSSPSSHVDLLETVLDALTAL